MVRHGGPFEQFATLPARRRGARLTTRRGSVGCGCCQNQQAFARASLKASGNRLNYKAELVGDLQQALTSLGETLEILQLDDLVWKRVTVLFWYQELFVIESQHVAQLDAAYDRVVARYEPI